MAAASARIGSSNCMLQTVAVSISDVRPCHPNTPQLRAAAPVVAGCRPLNNSPCSGSTPPWRHRLRKEETMKLSARNVLPGIIRKIERGAVNAEVIIELAASLNAVSVVTLDAINSLKLKVRDRAYAVV